MGDQAVTYPNAKVLGPPGGFPLVAEEIKKKTYKSTSELDAEEQLVVDLEKHGVADWDKFIGLDGDGRAHLSKLPTRFHEEAVDEIEVKIAEQSKSNNGPLLTVPGYPLPVGGIKKFKYPDLAIWGDGRVVPWRGGKGKTKHVKPS